MLRLPAGLASRFEFSVQRTCFGWTRSVGSSTMVSRDEKQRKEKAIVCLHHTRMMLHTGWKHSFPLTGACISQGRRVGNKHHDGPMKASSQQNCEGQVGPRSAICNCERLGVLDRFKLADFLIGYPCYLDQPA